MSDISSDARQMMRHALGLSATNKLAYRNRYFLSKKSRGWVIWASLVQKGLAIYMPAKEGDFDFFAVTTAGFNAVRLPGEKADGEEIVDMRQYDKHPSVKTDITRTTEPAA